MAPKEKDYSPQKNLRKNKNNKKSPTSSHLLAKSAPNTSPLKKRAPEGESQTTPEPLNLEAIERRELSERTSKGKGKYKELLEAARLADSKRSSGGRCGGTELASLVTGDFSLLGKDDEWLPQGLKSDTDISSVSSGVSEVAHTGRGHPRKMEQKIEEIDKQSQKIDTKTQKIDRKTQKIDPKSQKIDPKSQKIDPKSQKIDTKSQNIDTKSQKVNHKTSEKSENTQKTNDKSNEANQNSQTNKPKKSEKTDNRSDNHKSTNPHKPGKQTNNTVEKGIDSSPKKYHQGRVSPKNDANNLEKTQKKTKNNLEKKNTGSATDEKTQIVRKSLNNEKVLKVNPKAQKKANVKHRKKEEFELDPDQLAQILQIIMAKGDILENAIAYHEAKYGVAPGEEFGGVEMAKKGGKKLVKSVDKNVAKKDGVNKLSDAKSGSKNDLGKKNAKIILEKSDESSGSTKSGEEAENLPKSKSLSNLGGNGAKGNLSGEKKEGKGYKMAKNNCEENTQAGEELVKLDAESSKTRAEENARKLHNKLSSKKNSEKLSHPIIHSASTSASISRQPSRSESAKCVTFSQKPQKTTIENSSVEIIKKKKGDPLPDAQTIKKLKT